MMTNACNFFSYFEISPDISSETPFPPHLLAFLIRCTFHSAGAASPATDPALPSTGGAAAGVTAATEAGSGAAAATVAATVAAKALREYSRRHRTTLAVKIRNCPGLETTPVEHFFS